MPALRVLPVSHAFWRAMDSYVVRIYRRGDKKARILVGTAEAAGTGRKMAFSNIEEFGKSSGTGRAGILAPAVSATPFTEGGDERDDHVRPRGIRGGSASNQTYLGTLKGGGSDEKTFRDYGGCAPVLSCTW